MFLSLFRNDALKSEFILKKKTMKCILIQQIFSFIKEKSLHFRHITQVYFIHQQNLSILFGFFLALEQKVPIKNVVTVFFQTL